MSAAHAPLGPLPVDSGVMFRVFSRHAREMTVVTWEPDAVPVEHAARRGAGDVWECMVPGAGVGTRYGLRADGPWDPGAGHVFNPAKVLLDPYAPAVADARWDRAWYGHTVDEAGWPAPPFPQLHRDAVDSADVAPWGVVAGPQVGSAPLGTPWAKTMIYEAHVRGLTQGHPLVPNDVRGTYLGVAHPAVVEHLLRLGVTAVELLPVYAIADEPHLALRGAHNYWGYSSLSYFAPSSRYATERARREGPLAVCAEFGRMVAALHEAGLEVILDVVYNHTCEGGVTGPTVSFRGLDNASYYRLNDDGTYNDSTGCGNTLDFGEDAVVELTLASLRHWVTAYGVDGFRFDLAPSLGRTDEGFLTEHPFFRAVAADPVLAGRKLIAEPWDLGPLGWRTGQFPPPWAEWNDTFRDATRTFWVRPEPHGISGLVNAMSATPNLFRTDPNRPATRSVNFVTAHDGFTLADLVSYNNKHNLANGEEGRDGTDHNLSYNHGHEGIDAGVIIAAQRRRTVRAMLATLMLARGTPMLLGGDEFANTQHGNNNPYCLDSPTSWLSYDWLADPAHPGNHQIEAVAELARLRRHIFSRIGIAYCDRALTWWRCSGDPICGDDHQDHMMLAAQAVITGSDGTPAGWFVVNGHNTAHIFVPPPPVSASWLLMWDSTVPGSGKPAQTMTAGARFLAPAHSVRVYLPAIPAD